jgi:curli biogenesis system outer membrane secretion channel CsgG
LKFFARQRGDQSRSLNMKTPVILVTAALTVAILLAASLVIATGTRGEEGTSAARQLSSVTDTIDVAGHKLVRPSS